MPQHFLLSAAARTLSLSAVARMSDEEAHAKFVAIRWADNEGKPYCPACGCAKVYAYETRKLWKSMTHLGPANDERVHLRDPRRRGLLV